MSGSDLPSLTLRAEAACFAGWPALREAEMDGWLLRFGGGHTNRANSVNVVGPAAGDQAAKVAACGALYRAEGLRAVFRLTTARPEPGLEAVLDGAGYGVPYDASVVFHAALGRLPPGAAEGAALVEGRPDASWLAASAALGGLDEATAAVRARIFAALRAPAAFASVRIDGAVAAQAFGAIHGGLVCLNAVATAPAHRGRGLGTRVVAAVLAWAERRGAEGACLQTLADNPASHALYRRAGFGTELSRYHYRKAPA